MERDLLTAHTEPKRLASSLLWTARSSGLIDSLQALDIVCILTFFKMLELEGPDHRFLIPPRRRATSCPMRPIAGPRSSIVSRRRASRSPTTCPVI